MQFLAELFGLKYFFVKALDFPELSLCGKEIVERTCDGQTAFYFQDTRY